MHRVYISIKEFADRANISRQRVYQILDKKLKPYCKVIGNRKFIDSSALDDFISQNSCQPIDRKNENRVDNFTSKPLQKKYESVDKCYSNLVDNRLDNEIDNFKDNTLQINSQNIGDHSFDHDDKIIELVISSLEKQIETKDFQIKEKDKQIESKDNQIFELQNTIKSLQEQQMILTKSLANSQALHAGTIKEHIDSKAEKRGIFYWLFHFRRQK